MSKASDLDRVFTIASQITDDGPLSLLFSSLKQDPRVLDKHHIAKIVEDPAFKDLMGDCGLVVVKEKEPYPVLEIHASKLVTDVEDMENAEPEDSITFYVRGKGLQEINLQDNYYGCTLPQKIMVGCNECIAKGPTSRDCDVKRCILIGRNSKSPEQAKTLLKNCKTRIGGFTYIGPRLTAPKPFEKSLRPPSQHDFSQVEHRSGIASDAVQERVRYKKFQEESCAKCIVKDSCKEDI